MRTPLGLVILHLIVLICVILTVDASRKNKQWKGRLSFSEDFSSSSLSSNWKKIVSCNGRGIKDTNLECFNDDESNIKVEDGLLILTARPEKWKQMELFAKPRNYTSGKVVVSGPAFSYGTYAIRARMAAGKHLLSRIMLLPGYQDHDNCKYEEIDIMQGRGTRLSTLIFCAHYGREWNIVSTKKAEKVFRNVDFSKDFHEFAVTWTPTKIEWYVDKQVVYEATTYFYRDWILDDHTNMPCSKNKSVFKQDLQLSIALAVGGNSMFPEVKYGNLTMDEAVSWEKPTFEIDWVRIYQV